MAYGSVLTDTVQSSTAATAPVFKDGNGTQIGTLCRAWVNFNGTGTVAIRASFNVSSITDNGTGSYTVNFTNALSDANYSAVASGGEPNTSQIAVETRSDYYATTSIRLQVTFANGSLTDATAVNLAVFR